MEDIKEELIKILGVEAYKDSPNYQISENSKKMVKVIDYLYTQIQITSRWCDEEGKEHIKEVIKITKDILS